VKLILSPFSGCGPLPPEKQVEQKGEHYAHHNAGDNREVESELFPFYVNIPWESPYAQVGELGG